MLILIAILSIINIFMIQGRAEKVIEAKEIAQEFMRPAELDVTKILLSNCEECFDINSALEEIKKQNVNITKEKVVYLNENEAKALIGKYKIKKIPALIISGEVNKTENLKAFFEKSGYFPEEKKAVYTNLKLPYYNVSLGRVVGRVSVINVVDSSCNEGVPLFQLTDSLKKAGVAVTEEKEYEYSSNLGKELIAKFNITRIPAILISNEINRYENIKLGLQQLATEKNGYYALHGINAPYRDLKEEKIVGLVKLIFLTDSSCSKCFDVNINKIILQRLGVFINEEAAYDIVSEQGKALLSKYSIGKVPMLLMSPEAESYPALTKAWESVGTVEEDGWYVMRDVENLGTYKDLATNEIVKVQQ